MPLKRRWTFLARFLITRPWTNPRREEIRPLGPGGLIRPSSALSLQGPPYSKGKGKSLSHFGPSCSHLGQSWGCSGAFWGTSEDHLGHLGAILGHCGAILGHLRTILGHLDAKAFRTPCLNFTFEPARHLGQFWSPVWVPKLA